MTAVIRTSAPRVAAVAAAAAVLAAGLGLSELADTPAAWWAACALGAAAAGWLGWQAQAQRRSADRAVAEAARLAAVLATAPHPWLSAADDGGPLPEGDIASRLVPADAAALTAAMAALRAEGRSFRLEVDAVDGHHLHLTGRRGGTASPVTARVATPVDVVWIEDASAARDEANRLDADHRAAQATADELRTALAALPLPVWLRHAGPGGDLRLTWCNGAYARAVDAETDAAVAEGRELVPGGAARLLAGRALAGGFAQSETLPVVIGTQRRLMEVTEAPLPVPGGTLMLGYALDVTPVEELRTELDRHLAAHAEVLERVGSAIAVFGPDQRLTFFNQAYVRLWDLDEGFLRSAPTHSELMEELRVHRKLPEYADFQTFKRERLTRFTHLLEVTEELLHLPDGTTLRSLAAPHPLGGIITIMEDVTNTLALESSYNTLIAVQQETLDNLAEGIAVFGGDGRLKLSNPAFARIWDLRDEELQGEPHIGDVFERMRPFFADGGDWEGLKEEMVGATLERAVRSGRLERTDGSVVEFSTVPLPDGAVLNSYLDVTDSARLEQVLRAGGAGGK